MSYVDAGYADPISDRFYEERKAIEKALHGELAPSEEAKPFIKPLLENYHKRFPLDLLYEHYGWDNDSVYTALAENISDPVLNEYAVDTVNDINFDEFMDEKLEEIHWLSRLGDEDDKFEDLSLIHILRKQLRYVLDIQVEGCSDEILEREQRKLNAQYDRFVKRFGNVNGKTNARLFKPDGDSALPVSYTHLIWSILRLWYGTGIIIICCVSQTDTTTW